MSESVKRKSGERPKKRKFNGNRFTNAACKADTSRSSSSKKLNTNNLVLPEKEENMISPNFEGYRVFDLNMLFSFIEDSFCCKVCHSDVKLKECLYYGLSSKFEMICKCNKVKSFRNCTMLGSKHNIPEINRRFTYSMRLLGQSKAGMQMFCTSMDLPPPVAQKSYKIIVNNILKATSNIAEKVMKKAAQTEVILSNSSPSIMVSGDGTWKTRGHSSLTGVCTLIGAESGQVIDTEVMSSYCKRCEYEAKTGFDDNGKLHENCQRNHFGSAGKMEVDGMVKIFNRSESTRGVKYVKYIGDGDTKTFAAVCDSKPYGDLVKLSKVECVGHIQKRMGSRLRKLKQAKKNEKLSDGKPLSGKGRLTDKLINEITSYYGNAIREHKNSVPEMRRAIWAIFYHKKSTNQNPIHDFCPSTTDTWCKYVRASQQGVTYNHKNSVPSAVLDVIKPIFKDLSDPRLLERCLGGKTQNRNESLNSLIWKFCPKNSGAGRNIVKIATNEATIIFNEGCVARHQVMDTLQLLRSNFSIEGFKKIDHKRIADAEWKADMNTKEKRKMRKQIKLSKEESLVSKEGQMYSAGSF